MTGTNLDMAKAPPGRLHLDPARGLGYSLSDGHDTDYDPLQVERFLNWSVLTAYALDESSVILLYGFVSPPGAELFLGRLRPGDDAAVYQLLSRNKVRRVAREDIEPLVAVVAARALRHARVSEAAWTEAVASTKNLPRWIDR